MPSEPPIVNVVGADTHRPTLTPTGLALVANERPISPENFTPVGRVRLRAKPADIDAVRRDLGLAPLPKGGAK
ncbi:MAG: hypothetical protein AAF561_00030 [Planctomycetota bacterium]